MKKDNKKDKPKNITVNKKAFHDYELIEKLEAGISLLGSEIKAIREGRVNLKDSYIEVKGNRALMVSAHIGPYSNASYNNHEPERARQLLLHRQELKKLDKKVRTRGTTIVPLRMYFNDHGMVKVEIALVQGKRLHDKKQKIKEEDIKRDMDREMKRFH